MIFLCFNEFGDADRRCREVDFNPRDKFGSMIFISFNFSQTTDEEVREILNLSEARKEGAKVPKKK